MNIKLNIVSFAAVAALAFGGAGCGGEKKSDRHKGGGEQAGGEQAGGEQAGGEQAGGEQAGGEQAAADGTGTVMGQVKFTGTAPEMPKLKRDADPFCAKTEMTDETVVVNENGTLANVLVRIKPGSVKGSFETPEAADIHQENCMYRPRVQGAMADQEILINNADPTTHNVHAFDMRQGEGEDSLFNLAQPKGAADITKDTNGYEVMKFKCDVHPWMLGYIVVSDHPFFATTGPEGAFELKDVPAGTYTIEAWHEHYGMKTAEATVAKDGTAEVTFEFDGSEKQGG